MKLNESQGNNGHPLSERGRSGTVPRPVFNEQKCKACERCISVCPKKILELGNVLNSKGYAVVRCVDESACIGCAFCARMCPDAVIEIYK